LNYSLEDYLPGQQLMSIDFLLGGKNRIAWLSEKLLENPISLAMALAKHLLLVNENQTKNYLASIRSLTSSDLRKIAYRFFNKGKPVWVVIKPEKR
jgi:predicted Zn-dependent peptidase